MPLNITGVLLALMVICVFTHQNSLVTEDEHAVEKRAFASFRTRPAMLQGIHFIQKQKKIFLEFGIPIFCIIVL